MKYLNLDGLLHFIELIKSKIDAGGSIGAQNAAAIAAVEAKIPAQASDENQLADKSFVNSSVATNTANFIGTFDSLAALNAYSGTKTNNDYAFVQSKDAAGNTLFERYKWNGTTWLYEYALNNSSFTSAQWAAVNSGITAGMIPSGAGSADPLAKKSLVTAVSDIVDAITGKIPSAASATNQLADKSWVNSLTAGAALTASNPISNTNPPRIAAGRIQTHTVYNAGGPATYGNLVNIGGAGGGQVFLEWTGAQTAAGQAVAQGVWYRSMRDNQNAWTAWSKLSLTPAIPLATPKTLIVGRYADEGLNNGTWNGFSVHANGFQENFSFGNTFLQWCLRFASWRYSGGDPAANAPVAFAVDGRATITVAVDHPGDSGSRVLLVLSGYGKEIGRITLPNAGQNILTFEYDGGVDGKGETLVLAGNGSNINLYAVWVNSY